MIFVAFNLRQILVPSRHDPPACGMRIIEAGNLDEAKALMRKCHPGYWAIIPKKVYDQGVINPPLPVVSDQWTEKRENRLPVTGH